jgi:hypothetical protein
MVLDTKDRLRVKLVCFVLSLLNGKRVLLMSLGLEVVK